MITIRNAMLQASAGFDYYFVVGGGNTGNILMASKDLVNWTTIDKNAFIASCYTAKFYNNRLMCGGSGFGWSDNVTDLIESSQSKVLFTNYATDFIYKNGLYLASGYGGSFSIANSTDGKNWTGINNSLNIYCQALLDVNGVIWCLGQGTGLTAITTVDGVNFTPRTNAANLHPNLVCYGGDYNPNTNLLVIAGEGSRTLAWSNDEGVTWDGNNTIFTLRCNAVKYVPFLNKWFAGGQGTNTLAVSDDGINWTGLGTSIFASKGNYFIVGNNILLASGGAISAGQNTLAHTIDGTNWTGLGQSVFYNEGRKGCFAPIRKNQTVKYWYWFFGDSITAQKKWTNPLSKIKQVYNQNKGISGYTSTQVLTQIQGGALVQKTENDQYFFIAVGVNDVRGNVSNITYENNIRAIINYAISKGYNSTNIIVPSLYYFTDYGSGNLQKLLDYNTIISNLWVEFGLTYQPDIYTQMQNNGGDTLLNADHIHINDAGGLVVADYYNSILP